MGLQRLMPAICQFDQIIWLKGTIIKMWINKSLHAADGWQTELVHSEKWEAADDQSRHTPLSASVFEKVMANLAKYGDNCPQILSIDSYHDDVHYQCEIEIQLPGGVVIESDSHASFRGASGPETLAEASDEAAELVSDLVGYCAHVGFEKLTEKFDDARSGINKLFKQWSNNNDAHIHLVDLRIKTSQFLRDTLDTPILITISCLNNYLTPDDMYIEVSYPEAAVAEVMQMHAEMKSRTQAKARLERQGADGFIDLIAMNSLLLDDSAKARPESYIGILQKPHLHPDYKVECGRLYLEATDVHYDHLEWGDGYVYIYDLQIPSTLCESLPGKPITTLIEHPYLTSEIKIKDIAKLSYGPQPFIISFEQPYFCYCRKTGYFWAERESHELYR